ncbi:isocitrate lyase/phosphoenolpyruvate mutase family protein [Streptomyces decoyicus]|uniref:Isocitrate lyase/phosphoenolpyruvate mutase family protein n=1 Tax=Streptomyces decoyicus TaxID=249567 RepID=A0ABZ1FJW6_9ACTN|nr:isocitrate lyase/phosphoenolpyruvate mutase family protein [Streptomyces decoyicus]WSB70704.1 isocitrate lyase/phosphoenolpyruvate mutase family protein [Streptomyces decoyicus]
MSTSPEYATFHFHALHHADQPLLLPNAWDVVSAAALAGAGYAAVGTTSLGVAAAHGYPDGRGLAEVRDATLALALRLNGRLPCPYTVDVEGGFGGGPGQVGDLAAELAEAGAAGLNLEDGLPGGEGLQDPVHQAELISAVKERAPGLFLNARIDTHWLTDSPPPLSVALERAETYLAAGADGIFVPGVTADEDVSVLVAEIPAPLNILFAPGQHTVSRLAELGVRRISTGSLLFRTAVQATLTAADAIRTGRRPADAAGAGGEVLGYEEVQRLVAGEE